MVKSGNGFSIGPRWTTTRDRTARARDQELARSTRPKTGHDYLDMLPIDPKARE